MNKLKKFICLTLLIVFSFRCIASIDVAQSKVLLIYTDNGKAQMLRDFFDPRFNEVFLLKFEDPQQFSKEFKKILEHQIDYKTLFTIYYSGLSVEQNGFNYLVSADVNVYPPSLDTKNSLILSQDILAPALEKNPLGLFMFYDVKPWQNQISAFVKKDIPNVVMFYPTETGEFVDLSAQGDALISLKIKHWNKKHNINLQIHNQLDYTRSSDYCLVPYREHGCDSLPDLAQPLPSIRETEQCSLPAKIEHTVQSLAVVKLTVNSSACQKDQVVITELDGYRYMAHADASGKTVFHLFPTKVNSEAIITFEDDEKLSYPLTVNDVNRINRIILSWQGAIQLDLHVLHPRVQPNTDKDIWRQTACENKVSLGRHQRFDCVKAPDDQTMNMQVYTRLLSSKHTETSGVITFRVDYFDRGNVASPPYCGNENLATAEYKLQQVSDKHTRQARKLGFGRITCGDRVNNRYYEVSEKIRIR